MLKGLFNINENLPTPLQLDAVRFVEATVGLDCPTPLTLRNVETFLDSYLKSANELYFMEWDDLEDYPPEWDFTQ